MRIMPIHISDLKQSVVKQKSGVFVRRVYSFTQILLNVLPLHYVKLTSCFHGSCEQDFKVNFERMFEEFEKIFKSMISKCMYICECLRGVSSMESP